MDIVRKHLPRIRVLHLILNNTLSHVPDTTTAVDKKAIKLSKLPITCLTELQEFCLTYELPLELDAVPTFVESLSNSPLTKLVLNSSPGILSQADFNICDVATFARLENLTYLGLYVSSFLGATQQNVSFPKLETLDLGLSKVDNLTAVSCFLARVCPVQCRIESGGEKVTTPIQTRRRAWSIVNHMVQALQLSSTLQAEEESEEWEYIGPVEQTRLRLSIKARA